MKTLLLLIAIIGTSAIAADNGKQQVSLAPDGLPEQITIKADPMELPLELRTQADVPQPALQAIGRGEQLRAPGRLIARIAGQDVTAEAAGSNLKAGDVTFTVKTTSSEGRLDFTVTYSGGAVDALSLVLDLAGPVDTVVPGDPADKHAYTAAELAIGQRDGVVWANTGKSLPEGGRNLPGVLPRCFVGSGDRGFTWVAADAKGFEVDGTMPTMQLERDKAGNITWRCFLVNHPAKLDKPRTATFSILIDPTQSKPANARSQAWMVPSADAVAGDGYPLSLHRYLAGTHTGHVAQLRTNALKVARAGGSTDADRTALGRALLFDTGLDCSGLANLTEGMTVVKAFDAFGALKDDGQTEFIPYWRAATVLRYGETFHAGDVFELTKEDPMAAVHLSIWRRGKQALIAVVNESDKPVREQLYVLDDAKLFGGPNRASVKQVIATWDATAIPADSDWSKDRFPAGERKESPFCLVDVTDNGFVRATVIKGGAEVYGPLYIAAHSYRLLTGKAQ